MKEEQHIVRKEIAPILKKEEKNITKKVIQPIIKDVIQPIHIRVKPVLHEGIKPAIYKGEEVKQAINQGTSNLPVEFRGTKVEKEVMSQTSVKQTIIKNSTLPTDYKPTQVKPEIGANRIGMEGEMESSGIHKEINAGTSIRPSIIQNSVLPTINGGVRVLKTIYGGSNTSSMVNEGMDNGMSIESTGGMLNSQYQLGSAAIINKTAKVHRIDASSSSSLPGNGSQGLIMGVDGGVEDEAKDVTYSTKPDIGGMATSKILPPTTISTIRPDINSSFPM